MPSAETQSIVLRVNSVDQLFNDADANPFSTNELDVLGTAALEQLIAHVQAHPLKNPGAVRLVVALPAEQVQADTQVQVAEAIRRYCTARIEDNKRQTHISRVQHCFGMVVVLVLTLLVMALAYLLLITVLADSPSVIQGMIVAGVSVFAWVILWDPLESLLFDWAPPARENRALRRIMAMPLTVEAQS